MRSKDLLELLRVKPFQPFRILTSDGREYEIWHPDQLIVLHSRIVMPAKPKDNGEVSECLEHVSLLHIVRVEEISTESST